MNKKKISKTKTSKVKIKSSAKRKVTLTPAELHACAGHAEDRRRNGTPILEIKKTLKINNISLSEAKIKEGISHFDKLLAKRLREEKKMNVSVEFMAADTGMTVDNVKRLIAGRPLRWVRRSVEVSEANVPQTFANINPEPTTTAESSEVDTTPKQNPTFIKISKVDGKIGSGRKTSYTGTVNWPVVVGAKVLLSRSDSTKHPKFKTSEVVEILNQTDKLIVFKTRHGSKYEAVIY